MNRDNGAKWAGLWISNNCQRLAGATSELGKREATAARRWQTEKALENTMGVQKKIKQKYEL